MKRTWCLCALFALLSSPVFATKITRGPYFQLMRPHSVYVRYTTDNACDTVVTFRKTFGTEQVTASDNTLVTDHQVKITGFSTFIEYLYTIGTSTEKLMSGNGSWLWTSPDDDHPGVKMQFWVLGNSGDGKKGSKKVRNAFQSYMNTNNLINGMTLFLGNNTKEASEKSYKKKLFKVFKDQFLHAPFFTTLGENDTDGSTDPPPDLPYFTLFNLPTGTEGGGVASGTPKYYSFDYGIAHIVVLDSQSSDRSKNGSMMTWLKNDLEANIEPWLIAMFHHSPYSKGDHDSDTELEMSEMRQNALPILESHGVDLVLSAHSHDYERSYFIDGLYGTSDTMTSANVIDGGDGRRGSQGGTGAYQKHVRDPNAGAVYVVVGSSGKASKGPLDHPAMYSSQKNLGSLHIQLSNNLLDAQFIQDDGKIGDFFEIVKTNLPGQVAMTYPKDGSDFKLGTTVTLQANASDPDTHIHRVMFFINGIQEHRNRDFVPPYTYDWTPTKTGTYTILAKSLDELGALIASSSIQVTIK